MEIYLLQNIDTIVFDIINCVIGMKQIIVKKMPESDLFLNDRTPPSKLMIQHDMPAIPIIAFKEPWGSKTS
jgi:hypothetical protein